MDKKITFEEYYKQVAKMFTDDGFDAPSKEEVLEDYQDGRTIQESFESCYLTMAANDDEDNDISDRIL